MSGVYAFLLCIIPLILSDGLLFNFICQSQMISFVQIKIQFSSAIVSFLAVCEGMSLEGNLPTPSYPVTSQSGGLEFEGVM